MTQDESLLRLAIALAREHMAAGDGGPFGAVIARDDTIIAEGWNQVTSLKDPTAHAEVQAIRAACARVEDYRLGGCVLYASCEPCPMCLAAAYWARVDRIVYAASRVDAANAGFDDALFYQEMRLSPADRSVPMTQALQNEAKVVFEAWNCLSNRITY